MYPPTKQLQTRLREAIEQLFAAREAEPEPALPREREPDPSGAPSELEPVL
jgi:hypothetical protein